MSTLVATQIAAPAYQVGYGPSLAQAQAADIYTATNTTAATISPVTSSLVINASGTMTAVTVNLPTNATQGQRLRIFANAAVTTLTLTPATAANNNNGILDVIVGAVTALTANIAVEYVYSIAPPTSAAGGSANVNTWYRCG